MSALLRYQSAILLRSHRWIFPLIGYGLLIAVGAAGVSPASAAISHTTAQAASPLAANWPGTGSLVGAACLLALTWAVSVIAATRRDTWSASSA